VHAADQLCGALQFAERLIAAEHALQIPESVDETAGVGDGLIHLGPQIAELARHEIGAARKLVEITGAVGDLLGALVQLAAHLAGLPRGPGLLERLSVGPGDAPDRRDALDLADPLRHLLQVGKGLRRAQVVR
jgi:hypothetical protein